jgi:diadenylate cyclase
MFEFLQLVRWQDVLDILVVAFVIHQLISIVRGTRSVQMLLGIVVLTVVYFMASVLDLATLMWLLRTFLSSIFIIIIIVFQQDIRRALTQVGKSPFHRTTDVMDKDIEEIISAVFYLSKRRIGALIILERETGLRDYVESGFDLDANLNKELLISIFMPVSPLHDGGVIISKRRIQTAGSILPLTQNPYISKRFGTRHRAAIGLSEDTDAIILVVSEETKNVSLVQHGALTAVNDEVALRTSLRAIFIGSENQPTNWKDIFFRT